MTESLITFDKLVLMKLMSNRLKDKVHIQDLIGVGLIDASLAGEIAR